MDFRQFSHLVDLAPQNITATNSLPSVVLEALIPGYGLLHQIVSGFFHFDIGLAVSGILVLFGLWTGSQYVYEHAFGMFAKYFMSTITVEDDDSLFNHIMEWIAEQRMTKKSRDLKAVSRWVNDGDEDDDQSNDVLDESGIFNYEKWARAIPPRYEPNYGSDSFYFDGRRFTFVREKKEKDKNSWGNDEMVMISCAGRSTQPIKDLLGYVKNWTLAKESNMTSVYRASGSDGNKDWDRQSCRPSRPMATVSLDMRQKANIVMDVNEYLSPATAKWYASRGIPYRRGYLFYGPPGTGKTSLSFALAGIFGLNIYCISLMEVGLTESDLNQLFNMLPRRCIVLLEDIDAAGLRRADDVETKEDDTPVKTNGASTAAATKNTKPKAPTATTKSLISLSGLLNTIDGAASHEGRVLIMTTNHPEKLDPALVRPGRVDLQIQFTLATRDQIRDIFTRMYTTKDDDLPTPLEPTPAVANGSVNSNKSSRAKSAEDEFLELIRQKPTLEDVSEEKLREMAREFAEQLPELTFSPAEIQGFLLNKKQEPSRALREVAAWRDGLLEKKRISKKEESVKENEEDKEAQEAPKTDDTPKDDKESSKDGNADEKAGAA